MRVLRRVLVPGLLVASVGLVAVGGLVLIIVRSERSTLSTTFAAVAAVVILALGLRVKLSAVVRILEALRVVVPVAAYLLVTELVGPSESTLRFDEVGAQVIVVLLLALAVESRFFRLNPEEDRLDVLGTCLMLVVLAAGEYYALSGIFSGEPRHGEVVAGAIAGGFAGVAITALTGSRLRRSEEADGQ